jgi:hypothetical protein
MKYLKTFEEIYYDSRKPVDGYIDANDLVGQRLWFHTNRTHRNNGWNGMIGIYDTTRSGRKIGLAGKYTNEVRLTSPIFFQTSEAGAENIKSKGDRTLIAGVSGVVIPTDSNTSGMQKITYNPFDVGYFHLLDDSGKKEIVSADEVYFVASEDGNWEIWAMNPKFKLLKENRHYSGEHPKSMPDEDKDYINDILLELQLLDMRYEIVECWYHKDESDQTVGNIHKHSRPEELIKSYRSIKVSLYDKERRFFRIDDIDSVLTSLKVWSSGKYEIDLSWPNEMIYLPMEDFIDEFGGEELYTIDIYIYKRN